MMQQLLANRYQTIQHLGSGGFGATFLAQDTHLPSKRTCVIKQLKPINNNPQIYQLVKDRFQKEAIILEELGNNHGQIPSLYAYFEEAGQFYLVQEYIEGETLTKLVENQGIQDENIVKNILIEILKILEYIETKSIIHRDIKPDHIMIRKKDQKPILIDFGAVKETMGTELSTSGKLASSIIIGTPGYMPPEQAMGRPVFASDLYALSLTAIYLLTGINPQDLEINPVTGTILWRKYAPNISESLANILDQAINPQIQERFFTAKMMKNALLVNPKIPTQTPSSPNQNYPTKVIPVPTLINPDYPTQVTPVPTIKYNNKPKFSQLIISLVIISLILITGGGFLFLQNQLNNRLLKLQKDPLMEDNNNNNSVVTPP